MSGINRTYGRELEQWGNNVDKVWKEVQTEKEGKLTETTSLLKSGEVFAPENGNFDGAKVEMRQGSVSEGVEQMRQDSRDRLGEGRGVGAKALNKLGAILLLPIVFTVQLAKSVVGTVGGLLFGGLFKGVDKLVGEHKTLNDVQETARQALGARPIENSILFDTVDVKNQDGKTKTLTMDDALEQLRQNLGGDKRLSNKEMMQYVRMGERIVQALSDTDPPAPARLEVMGDDGKPYSVKPGLEVTRAISWYLQAKAISDNSGHGEGAFLKEGAMVAKDPGNKLYDFLRSSNESYGRVSSHMKDRTDSLENSVSSAFKGGLVAMMSSAFSGQPLQYGIEDFDNRMPSKGGSLLFDKLKPSEGKDGVPEIYLKWEDKGMPNSVSLSGGDSTTPGDSLWNRGLSFFRCLGHTFNFFSDKNPTGYRGEKFEKGEGKNLLNGFKDLVNGLKDVDVRPGST